MTEEKNIDATEARVYELGYHILPTVVADDLEAEVSTIRSAIEKHGGSFIAEGTPESMNLAYAMFVNNGGKQTKYERSYFGWMKFEMTPEGEEALRAELKSNSQILRFILFLTTREETRAQLQSSQNSVLREVKNTDTLEAKREEEEGGEVSEEALDKSIDDLVGDEKEAEKTEEEK